jgi:hypothetical protein
MQKADWTFQKPATRVLHNWLEDVEGSQPQMWRQLKYFHRQCLWAHADSNSFNILRRKNPQRDVTEVNYMAAAENSRMLRVVASVPVLSFPPPPKPSPLGFHRVKLSLRFII